MLPDDQILEASKALTRGGVILYPTDTIWGLGCDPFDQEALNRIDQIKKRSENKNYILLVDSIEMLKDYVEQVHPRMETLLEFHERPLTMVYPKAKNLPEFLTAENGSIAIRIIKDLFCLALIRDFGKPIVSTSANISGAEFPTHFGEINSNIIMSADYVVNFKRSKVYSGKPSILATYNKKGDLQFIRK